MKAMVGRRILSYYLSSLSYSVPCGGCRISEGTKVSHSWLMKCIGRGISTIETVKNHSDKLVDEDSSDDSVVLDESPIENSTGVDNIPAYIKLSDKDARISRSMISVKSKKNQKEGKEIFLEGSRLISDAIKFGAIPKMVLFSRIEDIAKIRWPQVDFQLYKVAYKTMQMWSSVQTCPGILGIFQKPEIHEREDEGIMPLSIVCDNIRDPGNMGSILRVAAGVGCKRVLLTKGCVELWDPKVLRSGAGSHFVLPVRTDCTWEVIWSKFLDDYSTVVLADNHSSLLDNDASDTPPREDIPLEKYFKVDYSGAWDDASDVVLILGGETAGLSPEAYKLAHSRGGIRLNIPLHNEIESLNAGTALGIISFEIRRQYDAWLAESHMPSTSSSEVLGK